MAVINDALKNRKRNVRRKKNRNRKKSYNDGMSLFDIIVRDTDLRFANRKITCFPLRTKVLEAIKQVDDWRNNWNEEYTKRTKELDELVKREVEKIIPKKDLDKVLAISIEGEMLVVKFKDEGKRS